MQTVDALEKYLVASRQVDTLALRQARMVCRAIADEQLRAHTEAVLMLALAALRKGSPRCNRETLLAPLSDEAIALHAAAVGLSNNGTTTLPQSLRDCRVEIIPTVDKLFADPALFAPVSGKPPEGEGAWPILTVDLGLAGFSKYWHAAAKLEEQLIPGILQETAAPPDISIVRQAISRVFNTEPVLDAGQRFHYRQVAAAALACRTRFLILSGGPGTGKTKVVLQILRTLLRVFPTMQADRIAVCAPTGRAKARIGESLFDGIDELARKYDRMADPEKDRDLSLRNIHCQTIHSLMGMRPDGSFRFNSSNRFPYQLIIVDEASMVDIGMFRSLLEAMAETCRLILVGDMYQLPSVDAGAVLGDLTGCFTANGNTATLSGECAEWVSEVTRGMEMEGVEERNSLAFSGQKALDAAGPLADHAILLTRSYRSGKDILHFARKINSAEAEAALKIASISTRSVTDAAVSVDTAPGVGPAEAWLQCHFDSEKISRACMLLCRTEIEQVMPEHVCAARDLLFTSAILTLAHDGPRGRRAINRLAEKLLRNRLGNPPASPMFCGMPVILGSNHHDLDLYNGDLGVVLRLLGQGTKVLFPRGSGYRLVALDRLADLEPAFALTVHKSQGAEFDNVLLVLPEHESPLLNRQVIYTGVTRAKNSVRILGSDTILKKAINTPATRSGGIVVGNRAVQEQQKV